MKGMPAYSLLTISAFLFLQGRAVAGISFLPCPWAARDVSPACRKCPRKEEGGAGKTDGHRPTAGLDGASFDSTDSKAAACSNVRTGLITGWGQGQGIDGGEGAQVCGLGPGSDFGRRR